QDVRRQRRLPRGRERGAALADSRHLCRRPARPLERRPRGLQTLMKQAKSRYEPGEEFVEPSEESSKQAKSRRSKRRVVVPAQAGTHFHFRWIECGGSRVSGQ